MEHTFLPAPQKRLYIPSFDALFNRNKKRKLPDGTQDAGIQRIEGYSNPMEVYQECIYDEKKRQEVINATIYTQEYKAKPWNSTVPEPFKLHTQERFCKKQAVQNRVIYKARAKAQTTQENGVGFKALPLNKKILQRPDFQPKKTEAKLTQPQEFHLHTEQRAALSQSQTSIDSQSFCPPNNVKGSVKPFKLQTEIRSQIRQQKQTLSQSQSLEPEVSSFKAQPLPSFYNSSQTSSQSLSQSMSQDLDFEHEYSVNSDGARRCTTGAFALNSEVRAEQRALFNESLRQRQKRLGEQKKYEEEKRKLQEEEEIRRLRKGLTFKAKPYKYTKFAKNLTIDTGGISYASTETSMYDVEMED
jgi:hypothetical protein